MPVQTRSQIKAIEKLAAEKLAKQKSKRITATLVTEKKLAALGLNPHSKDLSGHYRIVLAGPLVEFKYLRTKNEHALYGKWAVAPEGYYWASSSDTAYYNFDSYYLSEIPISREAKEAKEEK